MPITAIFKQTYFAIETFSVLPIFSSRQGFSERRPMKNIAKNWGHSDYRRVLSERPLLGLKEREPIYYIFLSSI